VGNIFGESMSDWIEDLYATNGRWIISRHPSLSKKFGLSENEEVALRFMANKKGIYGYLLTVGCTDLEETKKKLYNVMAKALTKKFGQIFKSKINILLYHKSQYLFSVTNDFKTYKDLDSKQLEIYFGKIHPILIKDKGTDKEINKEIKDTFHEWGRNHLSGLIVINDIDSLCLSPLMIIEFKQVDEVIRTWKPYLNEVPSYRCQTRICKNNKIPWYLMTFNHYNKREIAIHNISEITKHYIKGRKILADPEITMEMGIYDIPNDMGVSYKSTNYKKGRRKW
jgi:hypothetical protein